MGRQDRILILRQELQMTGGSLDFPPINGKAIHRIIEDPPCVVVCLGCEVSVSGGGQDGADLRIFWTSGRSTPASIRWVA